MGLGQFSECGLVHCLFWLRKWINIESPYITIFNHPLSRPHHLCVPAESTRMREWCIIIGLPVPWVCLLCQCARCARSVPACQRVILEVTELPWMITDVPDVLKALTLCHCARWQFKFHKTVLMVWFICF